LITIYRYKLPFITAAVQFGIKFKKVKKIYKRKYITEQFLKLWFGSSWS